MYNQNQRNKIQLFILTICILLINVSFTHQYELVDSKKYQNFRILGEVKDKICKDVSIDGSVVTQDDRDHANNNFSEIKSTYRGDGENLMKKALKNDMDYYDFVVKTGTALAVFILISILGCIGCGFYCIFGQCRPCWPCCKSVNDRCEAYCPPCQQIECCKKCYQVGPYEGYTLYWPIIGVFVCMLWIFIVSIIGLVISGDYYETYQDLSCASIGAVDSFAYGSDNWVGVDKLTDKIVDFSGDIDIFIDNLVNLFGNTSWIKDDKEQLDTDIITLVSEDSTHDYIYQNNPVSSSTDSISSSFFGTPTSSYYFLFNTDIIKNIIEAQAEQLKNSMQALVTSSEAVTSQESTFKEILITGTTTIQKYDLELKDFVVDIGKNIDQGDQWASQIQLYISFIYGLFLLVSIIIVVVMLFLVFKKIYCLRYILHGCWSIFSICQILVFLLGSIFIVISITGMEFCEIFEEVINNEKEFDSYPQLIPTDIAVKFKVCKKELGGNGQILEVFGILDSLEQIEDIHNNIKSFQNLLDSYNPDFGTVTDKLNTLDSQLITIKNQNYFTNEVNVDIDEHISISAALTALNQSTQCAGGSYNDNWVKKQSECSGTPSVAYDDVGSSKCFWIGGDDTLSDVLAYSDVSGDGRYNNCSNPSSNDVQDQVKVILQWRDEKNDLFNLKIQQKQQFTTSFDNYMAKIDIFKTDISQFITDTGEILDKVTDTNSGILADINCLFVGQQIDNMYDAICISFFSNIYDLSKVLLSIAFGMYFSSFFIFVTTMRFSWNEYVKTKTVKKVGMSYENGNQLEIQPDLQNIEQKNDQQDNIQPQNIELVNNNNENIIDNNKTDQEIQGQQITVEQNNSNQ